MVVALLNGKTKEEWYAMIKDRVSRNYGYTTPDKLPQIYATNRLMSFRARRQAQEEREREIGGPGGFLGAQTGLSGLARVLGSAGGISFHPGSGILSDGGTLMFEQDGEDEDEREMDTDGEAFFGADGAEPPADLTKSLKEQLDELDRDDAELRFEDAEDDEEAFKEPFESVIDLSDAEKDRAESRANGAREPTPTPGAAAATTSPLTQGEAPPPPPNGHAGSEPVEQLTSAPGGDAPSAAVKAEGLLDKSEDPLVSA
jgi:protein phosphatase 2C family protein 2/3